MNIGVKRFVCEQKNPSDITRKQPSQLTISFTQRCSSNRMSTFLQNWYLKVLQLKGFSLQNKLSSFYKLGPNLYHWSVMTYRSFAGCATSAHSIASEKFKWNIWLKRVPWFPWDLVSLRLRTSTWYISDQSLITRDIYVCHAWGLKEYYEFARIPYTFVMHVWRLSFTRINCKVDSVTSCNNNESVMLLHV